MKSKKDSTELSEKLISSRWEAFHNATRGAILTADPSRSVSNPLHQMGRLLSTTKFAQMVAELNPKIKILPHPHNPTKACIYYQKPDKLEYLFPCEGDWMPEWSIMADRKVLHPEPGNSPVTAPYFEVKRGWRTCLIRLIQLGYLSAELVERKFGTGDRLSWQAQTGKTKEKFPI